MSNLLWKLRQFPFSNKKLADLHISSVLSADFVECGSDLPE